MRSLLLLTLLCAPVSAQPFKSSAANTAVGRYQKSVQKARADYDREVAASRKRLLDALSAALKLATKSGDLKEANRLSDAIKRAKAGDVSTGKPAPQSIRQLVGTWKTRAGRVYEFAADGVVVARDSRNYRGRVSVRMGTLFMDLGMRDTDRLSVIGNRMFIEHWSGAAQGPPRVVESAYRVK